MADGYIGKISAVVTANTSDLSRRLAAARGDFDTFANRLSRSIEASSRSATASIDRIFTRYQRLEQSLRSALEINLRTDDQINKIRQLASAAEQINKPLATAASSFEKLSLGVQGAFLPALRASQGQVELLNRKINDTGSISARAFGIVEQSVARTAAAIQRLGEVQRLVSSGPNANSLALAAPRVSQSLQAAAAARQQASQLPVSALADGRVARQVGNLSAVENRIAEVQARIESLQLRPRVDTVQLEAARKELDRLLAGADRIRAGIQVRIDAQKAIADATSLNQRLDQLQENATFSITGTPQNLKQVEAELVRILGQFDKLTEAQRQPLGDQFTKVVASLRAGNLPEAIQNFQTLAASVELAANKTERLARANKQLTIAPGQPPPPPPSTPLGNRLAEQGRRRVQGLTGDVNIDSTPRGPNNFSAQAQRDIDALGGRVGQLRQQLETLPNSLRTQFAPALQRVQQQLISLQNSPAATASQIRAAATEIKKLEAAAERTKRALAVPSSGEFLGNLSTKRALAELDAVSTIIGQVGAKAGGPAAKAYDRLAEATRRAVATGTTGLPTVRKELERLQAEAAKAAAASGKISFSRAIRSIRAVGDVSRGAFGNSGLAIQQALFAIDDFSSVTGGLDQRIRAAGNNLTQLGFILAGTGGLFAGIALVSGAQLLNFFAKWYFESEKAEKKQKELKFAVEALNSSLERQAQLAQSIASAFKSAAAAIADFGSSPEARERAGRRRTIDDIREEQRQRRAEIASSINSGVIGRQGQIGSLRARLDDETDPAQRTRIQQQIQRLEREILGITTEAERAAERNIRNATVRAGRNGTTPEQELRQSVASERAQLEALFRDRSRLLAAGAPTRETDARIGELSASLARFEVALQRLLDDELGGLLGRQQGVADRNARIQAGTEGFAFSFARDAADQIQQQFDALIGQRSSGGIDGAAADATAKRLEALAASVESAQIAATEFSQALQSAAIDLAKAVESEVASRATQLRRDANAAEAQFGAGDVRTRVARDLEEQSRRASRQAEEQRRQIEAEVARERASFERDILQGQASPDVQALADQIRQLNEIAANQAEDAGTRQDAASQAAALQAQLESIFESFGSVQALRRRADEGDIAAQQQLRGFEDAARGQELLRTPIEREFGDFADRVRQIQAGVEARQEAILGESGRPQDFQAQLAELANQGQEAIQREFESLARGAAPAILGLADSVTNALLQGPSRAALNVTDISTAEGARELNRLLRGDDSARDQNLVELRTQSKYLEQLVQLARDNNIPVANN